uniref:Nuclease SbcCD subunit D n=1 Tax=Anaerolinea thermolimosa TaxID=229919 RepID=A0A7C4KFL4_9CHLR
MRILHFADAHIDIATHGRHDPVTGLSIRTLDFLKALDTIVDTAIQEKVDLVIFAGDAYKDRTPVPTFQREWGRRMMRLSEAGIPTLLLVGNHDLSPASGRAHALQEYETLAVPHLYVASRPQFISSSDLEGLPLQVIALPWIARSNLMASQELSGVDVAAVYERLEDRLNQLVSMWLEKADPSLPIILTAHASVQGAMYGGERSVMLGNDLVLPGSLVRDPRLDYVALGHIHKAQDLNEGGHHPVIYPGSIERVDFGEAADDKFFVIAEVQKEGKTRVDWRKLEGRRFIDCFVRLTSAQDFSEKLPAALPREEELKGAVVRLVLEYPYELESLLDEPHIRQKTSECLEFHLIRRPQRETRLRLPGDQAISSLSPLDLLEKYWYAVRSEWEDGEVARLQELASEVIRSVGEGEVADLATE